MTSSIGRRRPREPSMSKTIAMVACAALGASQASGSVVQQKLYGLPTGLAYYVQVTVGSPLYTSRSSKQFNLLVDTGSSNTAVVTADCCSSTGSTLFSCAASSTCVDQNQQISVSYITGSWSGELVRDTFSSAEIGELPNVPFTEIQQQSNFIQSGYDGIIGLAYPSIASPTANPPVPYFETIQAAKTLPNVFSTLLCGSLQSLLDNDVGYNDTLYSGELLLGGTTGAKGEIYYEGDLVYTPLVQERWYNVLTTAIKVGGVPLDVSCRDINTPRTIIDSGTSNIAFPPAVYSAIVSTLRAQVQQIVPGVDDAFFSDSVPCCGTFCDPTNRNSSIFDLPSLTLSLALDSSGSSNQQISITIPPEYLWRPLLISTPFGVQKCRVFGISEGELTLLGDVFMDGLFTAHDREAQRLGLGIAKSCPNGVRSTKKITVEKSATSFCDCVSSSDRASSLVSSYVPFSSKPCFFWVWWMYLVVVSAALIALSLCVILYVYCQRRRFRRKARLSQLSRQQSNGNTLDQNLLTPARDASTPPPPQRPTTTTTTPTAACALGGSYVAPVDARVSNTLTASTASRPSDVQIDIRRAQDQI